MKIVLTRREKITYSIMGGALIIAVILLVTLFASSSKNENNYRNTIAQKDSVISSIQAERNAYIFLKDELEKEVQYHKEQSQVYLKKIADNKNYYIDNKKQYESIPNIIRAMSKDSLRSAISKFR